MPNSSADRDPLDRLAEEFVARYRAGQRPSLTEYGERHPELADQIRDLFPALVEMEQLKPVTADHTGAFTPAVEPSDPTRIGEFRILRRVGHGGMGIVYEAVQESLGRHVALKLLPIDALADPKRLERFRREAKAAAKLHHTNIVPVFGTGESDGRHYYAMQFIAGHPLDAVIDEVRRLKEKSPLAKSRAVSEVAAALMTGTFARSEPPSNPDLQAVTASAAQNTRVALAASPSEPSSPALSGSLSDGGHHYWATVARIGAQAADALVYAHAQGILHRDIKPANLLLDLRGTVWVTDFGLAKATDADDLTHAGDIVGTLRYMAPERFDGQGDHRADVYALGLTLYELLTLKPAFAAESRAKLVEQVLAASPPKPRSINPAIPRDLETIVLKAIARDPAMRYASASEMADDLRRYQEDRPIRARRASSAEQAWRWCRRNPAVAGLIAAVLVVFAAGAGVATFFAVRAQAERERAEGQRTKAEQREEEANLAREKLATEQAGTRHLLYVSQMNHASVALSEGRIAHVLEILEETTPKPGEPDLRGWEWYYLDRLTRPMGRSFSLPGVGSPTGEGQDPSLQARPVVFSADGSRVACTNLETGGYRFQVSDVATGRVIARLPASGPPLAIAALIFNYSSLPQPILSSDGRTLAAWTDSSTRVKAWEVDSGRELSMPAVLQIDGGSSLRNFQASSKVFPEATGVRWLESTTIPQVLGFGLPFDQLWMPGGPGDRRSEGRLNLGAPRKSPDYLSHHWDRVSGQLTTHSFRPGDGKTILSLYEASADGRIGLFRPMNLGGGPGSRPASNVTTECWDIVASPPRRLWALTGAPLSMAISPGGKMVAMGDANSWTVYRAEGAGGEPQIMWKATIPPIMRNSGVSAVSDDGRIAFTQSNTLTILSRETLPPTGPFREEEVTRQKIFYHRDSYMFPKQFSPDSRTLLTADRSSGIVREWDAIPEVLNDHTPGPSMMSSDSRFAIEFLVTEPGGFAGPSVRDLILKNAKTGKEVGRIPGQGAILFPSFVAGSQRLLVTSIVYGKGFGLGPSAQAKWTLYDTDGLRQIATGEPSAGSMVFGVAGPEAPGGRWLIEGVGQGEFIVRDPMTGNPTCRVKAPENGVVAGFAFNRAEDRVVVVTSTQGAPVPGTLTSSGSLSVWMCDPASGAAIWDRKDLDNCIAPERQGGFFGSRGSVPIVWSPDEQRLLVRYQATQTEGRVWVGQSTSGTPERTLAGPADAKNQSGPRSVIAWMSLDPSGRRVAVSGGKEVRIWDLDLGSLIATLRDFDGVASETIFNSDSSRLFTLDNPLFTGPRTGRGSRIVVWDVVTGRLLLVLQPPPLVLSGGGDGGFISSERNLQYQDGKLTQTTFRELRVFDGNPVKE